MYKYLSSYKREETYGAVYIADYKRQNSGLASAAVIVFEDEKQALKYLSDKIANSEKYTKYKVKGVYLLRNQNDNTFIWVHKNYAITVSDYSNKMPLALMHAYLEKYSSDLKSPKEENRKVI